MNYTLKYLNKTIQLPVEVLQISQYIEKQCTTHIKHRDIYKFIILDIIA